MHTAEQHLTEAVHNNPHNTKAKQALLKMQQFAETQTQNDTPVVGMGATRSSGSDSYPYTIIEIRGKRLVIQEDTAIRVEENAGYGAAQNYVYLRNPNGSKLTVSLRKDGRYRQVGDSYSVIGIGFRRKYYDPCF